MYSPYGHISFSMGDQITLNNFRIVYAQVTIQGLKSSFASWEQHREFGLLPADIYKNH
jgi:hypothetical protein